MSTISLSDLKKKPAKEWWQSAADDQTPASGLTYNVRAGTTTGGSANPATLPATNEARFYRLANP